MNTTAQEDIIYEAKVISSLLNIQFIINTRRRIIKLYNKGGIYRRYTHTI